MTYPRTLEAVARAELSLWPVVDALVAELATTPGGNVRHGEYDGAATYLADNGFRGWSVGRLRNFHQLGAWTNLHARRGDFRRYPVEWVIEARAKARSDHATALAILGEAKSKRDIRPDRVKVTPEQVVAGLEDEAIRQDVLASPRGLSAVGRASIEAHAYQRPAEADPLPEPPAFASSFWRAVRYVEAAHDELARFGVGSLALEPQAREAAERMQRQAGEVAAALAEAAIEHTLEREA